MSISERMKFSIGCMLAMLSTLLFITCDLDRIDDSIGGGQGTFDTTIGGNANEFPTDVLANPDGTFIIVGYTQSFTGDNNNQAYIVKLDAQGLQLWESDFGGAEDDYAQAVTATLDGGYVFCGRAKSFNSQGLDDLYILKVNSDGQEVWSKSYGGLETTEAGFGICALANGDFLVGYRQALPGSSSVIRFMRINANGSMISDNDVLNGNYIMNDMILTSDAKVIIAGTFSSGGTLAYTGKFNLDGSPIWDQTYPTTNVNFSPAYGVVEMPDNSIVLAASDLGDNDHDFLVVSYTGIGMPLIDTAWGGANADELLAITKSQDGEIVVMGYTFSFSGSNEIYLSKRDVTTGVEIWARNFGNGTTFNMAMDLCPDGGFILVSAQNQANADILVYKTDAEGNFE